MKIGVRMDVTACARREREREKEKASERVPSGDYRHLAPFTALIVAAPKRLGPCTQVSRTGVTYLRAVHHCYYSEACKTDNAMP